MLTDNSFGDGMRWITVAPSRECETAIVFVEVDTDEKKARVGSQAAGHILFLIETDDCLCEYHIMKEKEGSLFR